MRRPVGVKNSFRSVLTLPERAASAAALPSALLGEHYSRNYAALAPLGHTCVLKKHKTSCCSCS